jgi:thiamine-phosphate pyrophosphorylase
VSLPFTPLLVITDRHQARRPLEDVAAQLFAGGCRWLSLREKDLAAPDRLALLRRLVALGAPWHAQICVHDNVAAAAAAGAAGVHLPAKGGVREARRALGRTALIGQSAHSDAEVLEAAEAGVDYVTLSPIFVTESKPGYGPPLGLTALGLAARRVSRAMPVLALGGLDDGNLAACLAAGAAGAAVMGGAMRAEDPRAFIAALVARMDANLVAGGRGAHN